MAGAKCEANTFDGERCVYGALTDDIRNLLRSYKAISNRLMRRDLFDEFLRKSVVVVLVPLKEMNKFTVNH